VNGTSSAHSSKESACRLAEARARQGVSAAEDQLLLAAGLRETAEPADFIRRARGDEGRGGPSLDELSVAFERLRARDLLTVVTGEDVRAEQARLAASKLPERDDGANFQAGFADFTPGGYRVHRAILLEVFGPEHVDDSDSFWRFDRANRRFTIVAPTAELCRQRIADVRVLARLPNTFGPEVAILKVSPPAPIGPWKPWRFALRDAGFSSVMTCGPT
jgi:hypothetical protein